MKMEDDKTNIVIPDSVTEIKDSAFYDCTGLTSIVIPNSVTKIGDHAFERCSNLSSITIGNNVTSIGTSAFEGCRSLTSVILPDSIKEIGDLAFKGCVGLQNITLPESLTSVGNSVFENCYGLKSATIESSIIGRKLFRKCFNLHSITLTNSVKSLHLLDSFEGCTNLVQVNIEGDYIDISDYNFADCTMLSIDSKEKLFFASRYDNVGSISNLNDNIIDHGEYIEFIKPINGIKMVQKEFSECLDWNSALGYAKTLNIGGYNDWSIPYFDELRTLYKIKDLCNIKPGGAFWSMSQEEHYELWVGRSWSRYYRIIVDYINETKIKHIYKEEEYDVIYTDDGGAIDKLVNEWNCEDPHDWNIRCIRRISDRQGIEMTPHVGYFGRKEPLPTTSDTDDFLVDNSDDKCFITSAVCKILGKPDDCPELTAFRVFRDTYMANKKGLNQEVQKYYEIAPAICAAIDAKGDEFAKQEYARIWDKYLSKAFKALKDNKLDKTYEIYKEMVLSLEEDYLI